jgi:hypothetical protein
MLCNIEIKTVWQFTIRHGHTLMKRQAVHCTLELMKLDTSDWCWIIHEFTSNRDEMFSDDVYT